MSDTYNKALIHKEALDMAVSKISLMAFFPASNEHALAAILVELAKMCSTDEQILWFGDNFPLAYRQWPGIAELRAYYCAAFKPADGIEAVSSVYPDDGIPKDKLGATPRVQKAIAARPVPLIEAPADQPPEVTLEELEAMVKETAAAAEFPAHRVPRTAEQIEAELYKTGKLAPITQEDVDALRGNRDALQTREM